MTENEFIDETQETLEPTPMRGKPVLQAMSWMAGVAAGGVLVFIMTVQPSLARGATHAAKAEWQLRNPRVARTVFEQRQIPKQMSKSDENETGKRRSPSANEEDGNHVQREPSR
ncbi:MAG: hypothetical protein GXP29_08150 [Planctomycetes bacterium]|nr:hypothetical protein [Planctomycetota bacterium]